ncbi:hypothetical protein V6767_06140 [Martelella sp. FLE1502]
MASPSEKLSHYLKSRWQAGAESRRLLPGRALHAARLPDPAFRAFLWINFLLPVVYTLYINRIVVWVQSGILNSYYPAINSGAISYEDMYARPAAYFMIICYPLEVLLFCFLIVQSLNISCTRRFPHRKRLFWSIFGLNFAAPFLGSIGFALAIPAIFTTLAYIIAIVAR